MKYRSINDTTVRPELIPDVTDASLINDQRAPEQVLKDLAGEVRVVMLKDIQYDREYQRELKPRHKRIARNFVSAAVGMPLLGERDDGSLQCIDGQQRIRGMLLKGIDRHRCLVVPSSGSAYESTLFQLLNRDRTPITSGELLFAAVTSKEPAALATINAINRAGLLIYKGAGGYRDRQNVVTCHKAVWMIASTYGEEALFRVLSLAKETWPDNSQAISQPILRAIATLVGMQGDVLNDKRFIARMKRKPVLWYLQEAAMITLHGKEAVLARLFVRLYNSGQRGKIPPLQLSKGGDSGPDEAGAGDRAN